MQNNRRKAAAALVASACAIQIGAWFAWWQTAWVYDDEALWHFQWAMVTASLVAAAALSAPADGYALWNRPPRYKGPRFARVADGASVDTGWRRAPPTGAAWGARGCDRGVLILAFVV